MGEGLNLEVQPVNTGRGTARFQSESKPQVSPGSKMGGRSREKGGVAKRKSTVLCSLQLIGSSQHTPVSMKKVHYDAMTCSLQWINHGVQTKDFTILFHRWWNIASEVKLNRKFPQVSRIFFILMIKEAQCACLVCLYVLNVTVFKSSSWIFTRFLLAAKLPNLVWLTREKKKERKERKNEMQTNGGWWRCREPFNK